MIYWTKCQLCHILGVVLAVSSSELLHQSINLLRLTRETKLGQKVTQGLHKLHVTKFHLVHIGIHHRLAIAVCVCVHGKGGYTHTQIAMEEKGEKGGERRREERRERKGGKEKRGRKEKGVGERWVTPTHTPHTHTHSLISLPQVVSDCSPIQSHITVKELGNLL